MISFRLDDRVAAHADERSAIVGMRRARARIVIVDAQYRIVAADAEARDVLNTIGDASEPRVPVVIESALREWRASSSGEDFVSTAVAGYIVRATQLDGPAGLIAVFIERLSTREQLHVASGRFRLSPREIDVLQLLLVGDSMSEIAGKLGIAECTVGDYVKRLFAKTNVRNRSEMIAKLLGWYPSVASTSTTLKAV